MLNLPGQARNWSAPVLALILTSPAHGAVLFDRAFFDGKPNTLIDFETLPDGTTLADLTTEPGLNLGPDAYLELGITTVSSTVWGRIQDLNTRPGAQFAHALEGSGDMFLSTAGFNFVEPVSAFMLFAADVSWGGDASFNIWFEDDTFLLVNVETHMQQITDPNISTLDTFRFGVVGFSSDSLLGISRITFSSGTNTFTDDLQFTVIPAPGALTLALPMALAANRRRRR